MVVTESMLENFLSHTARVKRSLVVVAIMLCTVVTSCESQTDQLGCGKRQENLVSLRITMGDEAKLGEFPWHAAVFSSADNTLEYICGGSIIHKSVIISSAHCFLSSNRLISEDLLTVHVGRVNLNETTKDQQVLNVSKIIPHPKFFTLHRMDYDTAILKLSTDIVMSSYVYPVCMWDKPGDHSQLVGKTGTIVGFGFHENDEMSSILQKAELTVRDVYDCLDNDRAAYGPVLNRNMYCAGGKVNMSACNGDSGGGMFFEENGTWFIRGIISFIAMRPDVEVCDSSKYTVFIDVVGFRDWVSKTISELPTTKRLSHLPLCKNKIVPKNGTCNVAYLYKHDFLLLARNTTIMHVSFDAVITLFVYFDNWATKLDNDCAEGRFYWITYGTKQIYSANYNGTDQKLFIENDTASMRDVAVDWISRRLYWTDAKKRTIEVASLENPTVRTVLIYKNLRPFSIAVDPLRSKLYWANSFGNEHIEWSNLDGSEREVLASHKPVVFLKSIKVSTSTGELCYHDQSKVARRFECIDPSSKRIRPIYSNFTWSAQFAITDELFYRFDWNSNSIKRINSNGVHLEPFIMPIDKYVNGMTAVTDKCPLFFSPCARNNGDCPENTICLVNSRTPEGRSCIVKKKCTVNPNARRCSQLILDN